MSSAAAATNARSRREEILDEATQLFAERGYEGTSMADLAEKVGLRKASLFHHFASKEVLYAAVLGRLIERVSSAIVAAAAAPGGFEERLERLSDAITLVLCEQPFAARLLIREVMDWGPVARDYLLEQMLEVLGAAAAFLQAGQDAGTFLAIDAKQLLVTLVGVHFMPFAVGHLVKGFIGTDPADPSFYEVRRAAASEHIRRLVLAKR
jgi:TetR/AcrR family transcriptional regulator